MSELKRKAIIDVILKKPLILDSEAETIADDILRLLTPIEDALKEIVKNDGEKIEWFQSQLTTLQAENERWEGLRSYLSHTFDCNRGKPGPEGGCTCGLTKKVAVLKEGE